MVFLVILFTATLRRADGKPDTAYFATPAIALARGPCAGVLKMRGGRNRERTRHIDAPETTGSGGSPSTRFTRTTCCRAIRLAEQGARFDLFQFAGFLAPSPLATRFTSSSHTGDQVTAS